MNDLIDTVRIEGDMVLNGESIFAPIVDVIELRKRMGMVFQKSNPFPMSVRENVAFGLARRDAADRRDTVDRLLGLLRDRRHSDLPRPLPRRHRRACLPNQGSQGQLRRNRACRRAEVLLLA